MENFLDEKSPPSQEQIETTTTELKYCIARYISYINRSLEKFGTRALTENVVSQLQEHKTHLINAMLGFQACNPRLNVEQIITNTIKKYQITRVQHQDVINSIMQNYDDRLYKTKLNITIDKPSQEPAQISTSIFSKVATTIKSLFTSPNDHSPY